MGLTKYRLGDLIEQRREKNLGFDCPIMGVSREGFISPKQEEADTGLYNVFYKWDFVFNPARMEVNSIALNTEFEKAICSSLYEVFYVKRPDIILPEYLNLYVKRDEFARHCEFIGWGSAREYCRVADISDIFLDLPPVPIQQKYVDLYNAMVANQKAYERGLDDLKLSADALLEKLKNDTPRTPLGVIVQESDARNEDGEITTVQGVNKDKQFMPSVASGADLTKYKTVSNNQFACNLMHIGRDKAVPIALQRQDDRIIVSPAYLVFSIKDATMRPEMDATMLPEFVLLWLSRDETDRYAWFMSDTSVRSGMEKKRFFEIEVPVPKEGEQKALVELYNALSLRRSINERLKAQIKDLCPILIQGSLEEAVS